MIQLRDMLKGERLIRYAAVGSLINLLLYLFFLFLIHAESAPEVAAGICYGLGVVLSYYFHRKWTFLSIDRHRTDAPKFLLSYCLGFLTTIIGIWVFTQVMQPEIAQLLNVVLTALVIYAALRFFRFGDHNAN